MAKPSADHHSRPFSNQIEKLGDVGIFEANATVARGGPNQIFTVCSMEIDIAVVRVGIFLVQPVQPQNTGQNAIVLTAWVGKMTRGLAAFELGPKRLAVANFFLKDKTARGCFEATRLKSQAEPGCGDRPGLFQLPTMAQIENLPLNIYSQFPIVRRLR